MIRECHRPSLLLFKHCLDQCDVSIIRNAARFSMPTDDSRFQQQIEQTLQRKKLGADHNCF